SLRDRMKEWQALITAGHELGNHSLFHPCQRIREGRDTFEWVKPEYDLTNYSLAQIRQELILANTLLHAVDQRSTRTYAYTCSDYIVGGRESYLSVVQDIFPAARGEGPIPHSMEEIDLHRIPSWVS
ncbi:MAG: polysaccharide deacetylase family protein, partial [Saprospiraceae bacterium]|nr:polysaccharide deacetylase family protein [Saprospiraceae bacterium]